LPTTAADNVSPPVDVTFPSRPPDTMIDKPRSVRPRLRVSIV